MDTEIDRLSICIVNEKAISYDDNIVRYFRSYHSKGSYLIADACVDVVIENEINNDSAIAAIVLCKEPDKYAMTT